MMMMMILSTPPAPPLMPSLLERQDSNIPLMNLGFWQVLSDNFSSNFFIKEWTPATKSNTVILRTHEQKYHYSHSYPLTTYMYIIVHLNSIWRCRQCPFRTQWQIPSCAWIYSTVVCCSKKYAYPPLKGFLEIPRGGGGRIIKTKCFKGTVWGWTEICIEVGFQPKNSQRGEYEAKQ